MKFQPGAHHNACIIPIIGDCSMTRVIANALHQTFAGRASRKSWLRRTCVRTRGLNSPVCSVICASAHADRPSGSRAMAEKSRAHVLASTLVRENREFFTMWCSQALAPMCLLVAERWLKLDVRVSAVSISWRRLSGVLVKWAVRKNFLLTYASKVREHAHANKCAHAHAYVHRPRLLDQFINSSFVHALTHTYICESARTCTQKKRKRSHGLLHEQVHELVHVAEANRLQVDK